MLFLLCQAAIDCFSKSSRQLFNYINSLFCQTYSSSSLLYFCVPFPGFCYIWLLISGLLPGTPWSYTWPLVPTHGCTPWLASLSFYCILRIQSSLPATGLHSSIAEPCSSACDQQAQCSSTHPAERYTHSLMGLTSGEMDMRPQPSGPKAWHSPCLRLITARDEGRGREGWHTRWSVRRWVSKEAFIRKWQRPAMGLPSPGPIASSASALAQRTRAGTSQVVQWLASVLPLQEARAPSLVGELRSSPMLYGKKRKKKARPGMKIVKITFHCLFI